MEFLDQLQDALGSTYRIERELGGGGMSRVFLAEETGLGRQVVIKVLPPEMAAGVNEDRFRREIQLGARLQHPHIVPLLTAGAAGELLYYVMPFIKGESLRAKIGREGELPVAESVRYLREVTDALAYAHGEGVVHRDIKPDNVLISGGHALVTDFGVAKAVSASAGGQSLTSMGLAIGTPAYMAPEQASGDPHVDHRADLYALGAMAFEMLTGRPPFQGPNPQSVLMAHVTQAPEHIVHLRAAVPPGLNSVVMRCLEKRAADRWQSAAELLPQLDLLLTPSSGGIAPTFATARISSGTEAAIRRSHPARVMAMYALVSLGVVGLVWLLVRQLGLPNWVLFGALALLLTGLPIMVVTARRERARALARTTSAHAAPPAGIERLFTWRRALTGGALGFAGLGILTAGYMAMRLMGVGTVGTLMAKGALAERDRIVLAEFDNRTADSTLGFTVTELIRTDLAQSRSISVYDVAQLSEVLARMALPRDARVTFDVAREAASRQGLKAVLAGEIASLGSSMVISARLVATQSGEVLWAGRETVRSADDIAPAIDLLSGALRERVGESLRSIRSDPPLHEVTTRSMEALRLYAQAQRANNVRDFDGAVALLERAIAQDSTFAMAYRFYATVTRNRRRADSAVYVPAFTRAYELRNRLSVRERYQAEGSYHTSVTGDTASAVAAYRALLDLYPDDNVANNNLGIIYRAQGRDREGLDLYRATIRMGTAGAVTFENAIPVALRLEGFDSVGALIDAFAKAYPDNPNVHLQRARLLVSLGRLDSAVAILEARREATAGDPLVRFGVLSVLVDATIAQGRLARASELHREFRELEVELFPGNLRPLTPAERIELETVGMQWRVELHILHDTASALIDLNRILSLPQTAKLPASERYMQTALFLAQANRAEPARENWRRFEASVSEAVRSNPGQNVLSARAEVARAEGRYQDAIQDLRRAGESCDGCEEGYFDNLARVFAEAGQMDSAMTYAQRWVDRRTLGVVMPADGHEQIAAWYERLGDSANAAVHYQKVVDLWTRADAVLQPRVDAARAKVAALKTA